jgi:excisionase family DNA binding protein
MRDKDVGLDLTAGEIAAPFSDPVSSARFPPILTTDQAAELIGVPKSTLYDWSSRGLLKSCSRRVGKRLLFYRDRLVRHVFNGSSNVRG